MALSKSGIRLSGQLDQYSGKHTDKQAPKLFRNWLSVNSDRNRPLLNSAPGDVGLLPEVWEHWGEKLEIQDIANSYIDEWLGGIEE